MATTPVAFLLSQNGKQVLLFSTFSIDQDAYRYSGQWNAGVFHGQGSYLYPNGDRYEGQWKNGQNYGYGTYTWANGDKWVGHFRDDEFSGEEGENTLTKANQTMFVGKWKRHEFWNGSEYNKVGKLLARYVEGVRKPFLHRRFRRNQHVRHWKFGRGSIVCIEGQYEKTRVQVRFESVGTKWLVLAYTVLAVA